MYTLYEIPRRSLRCSQCSTHFGPGSTYYSCLSDGFDRSDFCSECFQKSGKIYWKASIPEKAKQSTKQAERALELLRETTEPEMAYILALYLQRQKSLIRRHEDEEAILFEVEETEEMIRISKVDLRGLDVEGLQKQIVEKL